MKFNCIIAIDENFGISKNGSIPWNVPDDMKFFKEKTMGNIVIMGKNTFQSIPEKYRPLQGRKNYLVSSTLNKLDLIKNNSELFTDDIMVFNNLERALSSAWFTIEKNMNNEIYVCGGSSIYNEALKHPCLDKLYLTEIKSNYETDNIIDKKFLSRPHTKYILKETDEYKISELTFYANEEEQQYINILNTLLTKNTRDTRNAECLTDFSHRLEFDLTKGFPVLTTKRVFWRGIVEELIFFLRGETDSKILANKKIHIWDLNTTREFLDNRGLSHYSEGDMGPMYGWNWRHFGAKYESKDTDYTGKGFDQLKDVIEKLTFDKTSRRILMTALDPSKVSEAVLPPCHSLVLQFFVDEDKLSMQMYQRSSDSFLGLPFNITQHALLLSLMAKITGLKPYKLTILLGDTHIYKTHIDAVKKQVSRCTYRFPQLEISKDISLSSSIEDKLFYLENLTYDDFKLVNYVCGTGIKAEMVA